MNEFAEAADNYVKSNSLDPQFVFSHVQLAVAQYKLGNLANSMATFRRTLKAFPERSEPENYYGELLLDQQRFQESVEHFDKAIELEEKTGPPPPYELAEGKEVPWPKSHTVNVLPLVNKGLAIFQWKQDVAVAEQCCNQALQIDEECEAAVATLAQLSLQQGKSERAIELFARQAELARTEPELISALTFQYATVAQQQFLKNYPQMASHLSQIARSMMMMG